MTQSTAAQCLTKQGHRMSKCIYTSLELCAGNMIENEIIPEYVKCKCEGIPAVSNESIYFAMMSQMAFLVYS